MTIAAAISTVIDLGADVINLSLAMPDDPAIVAAVQRATAAGIKVVLAAGNDGAVQPGNLKAAIAGYPNAVLVGAFDWTGEPWASSNQPAEAAGTRYRYVWRPGVAVDTVLADGTPGRASGTSVAAPIEAAFTATGRPARSVIETPIAVEPNSVMPPADNKPPEVAGTTGTAELAPLEPASPMLPGGMRDLALATVLGLAFLAGRLPSCCRAAVDDAGKG